VSHGDVSSCCPDIALPPQRPLPGTARQRMTVGIAAGGVYRAMLDSDLDITLEGLQLLTGATVGEALFRLLDACHVLLDC
jgi:hypothetical protein